MAKNGSPGGKLDGETEDEFQRRSSGGPQVEGLGESP